jgi:hypothetical protein
MPDCGWMGVLQSCGQERPTSSLSGCSNKKKPSLSGDEPVEVDDFIESFELVKPPVEFSDTSFLRKEKDSLLISLKVFKQFVPDSVIAKIFGKNAKPKLYIGKRVEVEKKEQYLFVKAVTAEKKSVLLLCFDNDGKFKAFLPLIVIDNNSSTTQQSGLDRKYSIFKTTFLKKPDGTVAEGKDVYIYSNEGGQFILIMTEALDDRVKEITNPIDTLSRKNKFSADYVKDKMNIVSVRDGSSPGKLNFFIHFDRNNGECTGELKGTATLAGTIATYRQPGDGCVLQFNFTSSSVILKELEPCGSHRGVKCSFDGGYPRKKERKPAKK